MTANKTDDDKKRSPVPGSITHEEWLRSEIASEKHWFLQIELAPGVITPGWSNPKLDKLPHYGLPEDMTGMRVLDIGANEGFFSFEAERRGAEEVVAIDAIPSSVRRFNICNSALRSKVTPYLCNVYDLNPKAFGTFDLVFFFGVLYHLKHPLLALDKVASVSTGTMLLQTATYEVPGAEEISIAKFNPFGEESDGSVFWRPNAECVRAMVAHVGFQDIETIWTEPKTNIVVRAQSPKQVKGEAPDPFKSPWA